MVSYKERTRGLVTHTKLEDFIFCPMLYKLLWKDEEIDADDLEDEEEEEKSEALLMGSAFDVYIQDVAKFNEEYAIVTRREGKT